MTVDRSVIFKQSITETYLVLIEIRHLMLPTPIRLVNDTQNLTAFTFLWNRGYMELRLPDTTSGNRSSNITIQNVDNRIGQSAKRLIGPATVKFRVVRRDTPDIAEVEYPTMRMTDIRGNSQSITATLASNHLKREPYPFVTASKDVAPGIFI